MFPTLNIDFILNSANIKTEEELIIKRETSYPNQNIPIFTSTSSRPDNEFGGKYGAKVYPVVIPKGTKIFYISAYDKVIQRMARSSEEEFILEKGTTKLVGEKIIFTPH